MVGCLVVLFRDFGEAIEGLARSLGVDVEGLDQMFDDGPKGDVAGVGRAVQAPPRQIETVAGLGDVAQGAHQARFTEPGVADQQDRRAAAEMGRLEAADQQIEFGAAGDQGGRNILDDQRRFAEDAISLDLAAHAGDIGGG